MNITIRHPEQDSLAVINRTIEQGLPIYRSPHVGNVNGNELALITGLAELGAEVRVEMIDSIRGDDGYSKPLEIITSTGIERLCSRNAAKSKVVGMCVVAEQVSRSLSLQLPDIQLGASLQQIHLNSLAKVMPNNVALIPSTQFYQALGQDGLDILVQKSAETIGRETRYVSSEGKILPMDENAPESTFGSGENPMEGKLIPLEAMMAAELIIACQNSGGQDTEVVHVAGPHMIEYTKDPHVMNPTAEIAQKVAAELGIGLGIKVSYVLPGMATLLADSSFPKVVDPLTTTSQYDILGISL